MTLTIRAFRKVEPVLLVVLLIYFWDFKIFPIVPFSKGQLNILTYPITLLLIVTSWRRVSFVLRQNFSILLILILVVASSFWSSNPSNTLDVSKAIIRNTLLGIYLGSRYSLKEQILIWQNVFKVGLVLSLISGIFFPVYGTRDIFWNGIFSHKQYLGRFATFALSFFSINVLVENKGKLIRFFFLAISFSLVILSHSKTSLFLSIVILFSIPFIRIIKARYKSRTFLISVSLFSVIIVVTSLIWNIEKVVIDLLGRNLTFSGRTQVWALALENIFERPFLGYGFGGFWTSEEANVVLENTWAGSVIDSSGTFHSHNGYIDLLLSLGLLGMLLLLLNLFQVVVNFIVECFSTKKYEYYWLAQSLFLLLVFNGFETKLLVSLHSVWIMYLGFSCLLLLETRRRRFLIKD